MSCRPCCRPPALSRVSVSPAVLVPAEALRPALRRLVWCEVDGGSRWAAEVLGEVERAADGALLEIVDEERRRRAAVRRVPT